VLELLDAVLKHLAEVDAALVDEDCLTAIQRALEAKQLCRRASASVVADCLRDLMVEARETRTTQPEKDLEALLRVVRFVASELCSPCRQALNVMWKEGV
jgi:hypothetical protein